MNKCKWCGGNDVSLWVIEKEGSLIAYYLRCNNCGMKTKKYRDKAFAIDEWNNIQMKGEVSLDPEDLRPKGEWKYYHKENIAVCTNCNFERDLDVNFGRAVSCPNCGAKMEVKSNG